MRLKALIEIVLPLTRVRSGSACSLSMHASTSVHPFSPCSHSMTHGRLGTYKDLVVMRRPRSLATTSRLVSSQCSWEKTRNQELSLIVVITIVGLGTPFASMVIWCLPPCRNGTTALEW